MSKDIDATPPQTATAAGAPKHTPGPWRAERSEHWPNEFVITGSNEHGGSVLPILGRTHNWPNNAEANARLIAAAPDLLWACHVALAAMGNSDAGKVVRAAIAKAIDAPQAASETSVTPTPEPKGEA